MVSIAQPPTKQTSTTPRPATRGDTWLLRRDLRYHWIEGSGDEGYWVVKDPFGREWFCVTALELKLLRLADGCRSLAQVIRAAVSQSAPLKVSDDALTAFYAQARRKGLLIPAGRPGPVDQSVMQSSVRPSASPLTSTLGKLIAYRFPGLHPNSLPQIPHVIRSVFASTGCRLLAIVISAFAFVTALTRFDQFSAELNGAFSRSDATWWLTVLVTIAAAKTVHELAHLIACRMVGAECRELGVMLLFGMPCLYCDVSDLWTVPQRMRRIAVSAAGIFAELMLAVIATLVWATTQPSLVHDLALIVMVICSVSTFLINANPLLRYDGYFILSDALNAPNLAGNAFESLRRAIRRLVWGSSEKAAPPRLIGRRLPGAFFVGYALASGLYRLVIVGMISVAIYHRSVDTGFGWVGATFGLLLIASMSARAFHQTFAAPAKRDRSDQDQHATSWWRNPRAASIAVMCVLLILVAGLIPVPSHVVVPMWVAPNSGQDVQATESGRLAFMLPPGTEVQAGEVLMRMENDGLSERLLRAEADLEQAMAIAEAWQSRRYGRKADSTALAIAKKRVEAAREYRDELTDQVERLTLRAATAGHFHPRHRLSDRTFEVGFQPGQWIDSGTQLGWVGRNDDRRGLGAVAQAQMDLLQVGQTVQFRHRSFSPRRFSGIVEHVDQSPWQRMPPELSVLTSESSESSKSTAINYSVRIAPNESNRWEFPIGSVVDAEIAVGRRSLWERLHRLLSSEFRGL